MTPIKITIDHNNDTITIAPDEFKIDTQVTKFVRIKDTSTVEKVLYEIFNTMATDGSIAVELESINEDRMKSESW